MFVFLIYWPGLALADYTCTVSGREANYIPPEYFGIFINTYEIPSDAGQRLTYFKQIKQAGFYSVRFQMPWSLVERPQGNYDWSYFDPIFLDLEKAGLKALPTLVRVPVWARPKIGINKDKEVLESDHYPEWQKFVSEAVKRYSENIGSVVRVVPNWEIFNEPELSYQGTPQNMVEILNLAYDTIKRTDPKAKVFAPPISTVGLNSLFGVSSNVSTDFFKQIVLNGKFDVINIHLYHSLIFSVDFLNKVKNYISENGSLTAKKAQLAVTESNENLYPCDEINNSSSNKRARNIINRYVCLNQFGVDYLYYFKSMDFPVEGECGGKEILTGIFNRDYSRKDVYFPIANMVATLSNKTISKVGDLNFDNNVNDEDVNLLKNMFSSYSIFDYNKIVSNWKK